MPTVVKVRQVRVVIQIPQAGTPYRATTTAALMRMVISQLVVYVRTPKNAKVTLEQELHIVRHINLNVGPQINNNGVHIGTHLTNNIVLFVMAGNIQGPPEAELNHVHKTSKNFNSENIWC